MRHLNLSSPVDLARRITASLGAAVLTGALLSAAAQAQTAPIKNRLVFQVSDNDPGKWALALSNAQDVQKNLGTEPSDLEIVVYGPGIGMLQDDSPMADRVSNVLKKGIKIVACETTLTAKKLSHADMLPNIGYVPGGVIELMRKQQQGYAYVRP